MLKKAVQQGRSERRPEAYPLGYVEDLNDARTMLVDFFSILLGRRCTQYSPACGACSGRNSRETAWGLSSQRRQLDLTLLNREHSIGRIPLRKDVFPLAGRQRGFPSADCGKDGWGANVARRFRGISVNFYATIPPYATRTNSAMLDCNTRYPSPSSLIHPLKDWIYPSWGASNEGLLRLREHRERTGSPAPSIFLFFHTPTCEQHLLALR